VKFNLIDKIETLTDDRIVAVKYVSLAEEYLADHFPTFPVLPGVMMLEALTQAAGWLLHRRHDFSKSMAVLKEARNVKYGNFVAPGNFLRVDVEFHKQTPGGATFKASGSVGDAQAVAARLEIAYFNLAEKQPALAEIDARLREHNRRRWALIAPPPAATATTL
jgi:3-hydroxyacyl-[acyl-carrier-protein] dehydratase